MNLSIRIRRARAARRLSQAQLAELVGVQRSSVAQWERKNGTSPNATHLQRIAEALEISFEWLATERGPFTLGASYNVRERIPMDFAQDEVEGQILAASRRLNDHKRRAVLLLMDALATKSAPKTWG